MKKTVNMITGVVFIMVLTLLALFSTGCFTKGENKMNTIRICTFNVRTFCIEQDQNNMWFNRLPRIINQIKTIDPDLIGFQETRSNQYDDLVAELYDYDSEYLARDGEFDEGTPIFYKRDKFELIKKGSYYLNEHPDRPGIGWDAACLRVASFVSLKEKATGKYFTYFNTHLDHIGTLAQVNGIKLMVEKMKACGGSMILSGDFNVYEGSETYNVAASLLNDSKTIAKNTHENFTFHGYGDPSVYGTTCIDYIFVSTDIKVENYCVYDKIEDSGYASDHYALYSDLVL